MRKKDREAKAMIKEIEANARQGPSVIDRSKYWC